jgi:hypothetical protein
MWDRRIDLQTLEEIPQTLEKVQEGIVTRRDPTGGLANSFITREPIKESIKGTNREEHIDPNEQCLCWWKWNLTGPC